MKGTFTTKNLYNIHVKNMKDLGISLALYRDTIDWIDKIFNESRDLNRNYETFNVNFNEDRI